MPARSPSRLTLEWRRGPSNTPSLFIMSKKVIKYEWQKKLAEKMQQIEQVRGQPESKL